MIKINECTITETARAILCSYQCVPNWLYQFEEFGLEDREDLSCSSRPPLIPRKKLLKIEKLFKKLSGGMTPKKLMQLIFDRTGIIYHITRVCRIMHSWNLKPKVPQKLHVRAVSTTVCYMWCIRIILRIKKAKEERGSYNTSPRRIHIRRWYVSTSTPKSARMVKTL